jgi:hypothetical protein
MIDLSVLLVRHRLSARINQTFRQIGLARSFSISRAL